MKSETLNTLENIRKEIQQISRDTKNRLNDNSEQALDELYVAILKAERVFSLEDFSRK